MTKKMTDQLAPQFRALQVSPMVDMDARTMSFPFSSEEPCNMWYGDEVLSHKAGAMRQGARQTSMPLLFNHDRNDLLGVCESISIDNNRGVATVRFGKDERGEWAMQQARDGVLVNASFMYRVFKFDVDEETEIYTATDWEAYEVSLVTVPADATVGVGRSSNESANDIAINVTNQKSFSTTASAAIKEKSMTSATQAAQAAAPVAELVNLEALRQEGSNIERKRSIEIDALCDKTSAPKEMRESFKREGTSIDEARAVVLDHLTNKKQESLSAVTVDASAQERGQYSLSKALLAQATGDWSKAGLERAVHQDLERTNRASNGGLLVPDFAMRASAQNVGTSSAGGALVATNLLADQFIEALRPNSAFIQAGIQTWGGLVGNVDVPKQTSRSRAYWVGEDAAATATSIGLGKIATLTPKTLSTNTSISRTALLQTTPAIDSAVRSDLLKELGLAVDYTLAYGTGTSFQPLGLVNQVGIGSVVSGGSITIDELIDLETAIRAANVNGELKYITNPKVIAALKKLKATTGQQLWTNNLGFKDSAPGEINGYSVFSSNNVASNGDAHGNLKSHVILGDFSQVVMGTWGALELKVDPYKYSDTGALFIVAFQSMDFAVRHPEAFALISDLTY